MFVRMPPPTPAKPEHKPIAVPAMLRKLPAGWPLHDGAKSARKRKPYCKGQAKQGEDTGHHAAAKVRGGQLRDDNARDYAGSPFSEETAVSVPSAPVRQ